MTHCTPAVKGNTQSRILDTKIIAIRCDLHLTGHPRVVWSDRIGSLGKLGLATPSASVGKPNTRPPVQEKSSSTSAIKIQALQFIGLALAGADSLAWQPQIARLGPPVFAAVSDRYYKVAAAALRVCEALVVAIRPSMQKPVQPAMKVNLQSQALMPLLQSDL